MLPQVINTDIRAVAPAGNSRHRFTTLIPVALLLILSVFPAKAATSAENSRLPNIVFILADDLGYGDLGCYHQPSEIPTPHLDRLATQGMRFTDAHTPSSVCSPTRYALLTGRYAWRTVLKSLVLWAFDRPLVEPDRFTLPRLLAKHNYHTACIGKWHLGWIWKQANGKPLDLPFEIGQRGPHAERVRLARAIDYKQQLGGGPLAAGFDYYFGDDVINQPPFLWIENQRCLTLPTLDQHPAILRGSSNGPATPNWNQADVLPRMTRRAVDYLGERSQSEQPFFLYFPLTAPHLPIVPPPRFAKKSSYGPYGDFVVYVDAIVGQVLKTLDEHGLRDHTLVVFTSDNGSYAASRPSHRPNGHFRGRKGMIFDGGHRVPLIVRWPGRVKANTINKQLVGLNDFFATVAEILEYRLPANAAPDSVSFLSTLKDNRQAVRQELVHHSASGEFAIRSGRWKLIPASQLLFDMDNDAAEQVNMWADRPEVVERLSARLKQIRADD